MRLFNLAIMLTLGIILFATTFFLETFKESKKQNTHIKKSEYEDDMELLRAKLDSFDSLKYKREQDSLDRIDPLRFKPLTKGAYY